jgi:estrogen-related receptor beta like 1
MDDSAEAEIEEDENDVEGLEEDIVFESDLAENSLDSSMHNILQAVVDPVEWKTELERVGPKLKASQNQNTNEWRSHVDQTLTNKLQIEKILTDTQSDLQMMFK